MCTELTEEVINKMYDVAVSLGIAEKLTRILLNCINDDDNLKAYDIENLSSVLNKKIIQTKEDFYLIHEILDI